MDGTLNNFFVRNDDIKELERLVRYLPHVQKRFYQRSRENNWDYAADRKRKKNVPYLWGIR